MTRSEDLINTAGIAEIFKCTREHATDRIVKKRWFPKPVINHSQKSRLWSKSAVIEAAKRSSQR